MADPYIIEEWAQKLHSDRAQRQQKLSFWGDLTPSERREFRLAALDLFRECKQDIAPHDADDADD
jgi:hypothetical protein